MTSHDPAWIIKRVSRVNNGTSRSRDFIKDWLDAGVFQTAATLLTMGPEVARAYIREKLKAFEGYLIWYNVEVERSDMSCMTAIRVRYNMFPGEKARYYHYCVSDEFVITNKIPTSSP